MLVAIEEYAVEFQTWGDKSAMLQFVNGCDGGGLILGDDAEQELEFYSVMVYFDYGCKTPNLRDTALRSWCIGLISEGHGLKPQLLALPDQTLVFGLNHQVIGISSKSREILFSHRFDTLFQALFYLCRHQMLVVRNEIGVVALAEDGHELWRFEKDLVTDCFRTLDSGYRPQFS
jgi:hypothetical protein